VQERQQASCSLSTYAAGAAAAAVAAQRDCTAMRIARARRQARKDSQRQKQQVPAAGVQKPSSVFRDTVAGNLLGCICTSC
jgi:hypothetical protein